MRYPTPALWRVQLVEVHDGDTARYRVDRGDDDQSLWWVRLKDVHAPELSQPGGSESRAFAVQWHQDNGDGSEWPFMLETFRTPRSDVDVKTLSRLVGRVTSADGYCLNDDVQAFVTERGFPGGAGS